MGYFAFYSEERPWGNNWLTWSVVPALAVDLVYSRALLVAPGLQRALYGAGDVEGVGVVYDRLADGSLHFDHALADDGTHDSRCAVARASRSRSITIVPPSTARCGAISSAATAHGRARTSPTSAATARDRYGPLPDSVARAFRVDWDDRAPPAHVERTGARRIDFVRADAPRERGRAARARPKSRGASVTAPVLPRG